MSLLENEKKIPGIVTPSKNIKKHNSNIKINLNFKINTVNNNYLNVLKRENTNLNNEIKTKNNLLSQLKSKLFDTNNEKNNLINIDNENTKNIEEIKSKLEQTKQQINILQNKNINITNLHKKITDLEFKLKKSESLPMITSNTTTKKFNYLQKNRNISMIIQNQNDINDNDLNVGNKDYSFITSENKDLIDVKENNLLLSNKLNNLYMHLNNLESQNINLKKQINQNNIDKKKLLILLNEKNENMNKKISQENSLNNNKLNSLLENKKVNDLLSQKKLKQYYLEKDQLELENVIYKQGIKINELINKLEYIKKQINEKNEQIFVNQNIIKKLENNIRILYIEFKNFIQNEEIRFNNLPLLITQLNKNVFNKDYDYNINYNNNSNEKIVKNIHININKRYENKFTNINNNFRYNINGIINPVANKSKIKKTAFRNHYMIKNKNKSLEIAKNSINSLKINKNTKSLKKEYSKDRNKNKFLKINYNSNNTKEDKNNNEFRIDEYKYKNFIKKNENGRKNYDVVLVQNNINECKLLIDEIIKDLE